MEPHTSHFPELGFGLGLRPPHYAHILEHQPAVDWFEIISENFMDTDGKAKRTLTRIREHYPIVMHGVALSIGTVDPLNSEYLIKLKKLIEDIEPVWVSDHLCWTGIAHKNTHDLLPVPYTEEALKHIVARIDQVQEFLQRPIALENPSTYLEFKASYIPEAEFIAEMTKRSGCYVLLDVNNVYVSCYNHRLDPKTYIDALPLERVVQIHLSGHSHRGTHIIDTHDDHVVDDVWALYRYVIRQTGRTLNTLVEWDAKLPSFETLYAELEKAKTMAQDAQHFGALPQWTEIQSPQISSNALSLQDTQTMMQQSVLQGTHTYSPDTWIHSKQSFSAAQQLTVYAHAYRYRLQDVTAEDYPILRYYLGNESFRNLMEAFVEATFSTHFNIGRYASQLPGFLAQHHPDDICAYELAQLETAIAQLNDPLETFPLETIHLQGITPEILMNTVLQPRTALQLLALTYPLNAYYIAVENDEMPMHPSLQESFVAVFRHADIVWRMDLEKDEYTLLQTLFTGMPIGAALEALQQEHDIAEETLVAHLPEWFSRWLRNGLLAAQPIPVNHFLR